MSGGHEKKSGDDVKKGFAPGRNITRARRAHIQVPAEPHGDEYGDDQDHKDPCGQIEKQGARREASAREGPEQMIAARVARRIAAQTHTLTVQSPNLPMPSVNGGKLE